MEREATDKARLYELLLWAYPHEFRARFGGAMLADFRDRRRRARGAQGVAGVARVWLLIARDLLISLPREWLGRGSLGPPGGRAPRGGWLRDLRYAWRALRLRPGFTAIAVLTLTLGIGANAAIFAIVSGALLRPLPYPDDGRIVRLWANLPEESLERFSFTKIEFRAYAESTELFEAVGGDFPLDLTLTGDGEPQRLSGAFATPEYFAVFGATPELGRAFDFTDIDGGRTDVVVVSDGFWRRQLGGDPEAIGRRLSLNGRPYTVLGVLPRWFRHPTGDVEIYVPYTVGTERWIARWLELSARLAPGVTPEQAQAELVSMHRRVAAEQERSAGWTVTLEPLRDWLVGPSQPAMLAAGCAVLLLLLLACANVANLFLARATTRQRDLAVQRALGARGADIARQTLLESAIVAAAAAIAGIALAAFGLPVIVRLAGDAVPRLARPALDGQLVAVITSLALTTGLLFGGVPALYAGRRARAAAPGTLRVTTGRETRRLLSSLIVAELALAVALTIAAGLLVQTFHNLRSAELGFSADDVVSATISLPGSRYRDAADTTGFYDRLLERVRALPGTHAVGIASQRPLGGRGAVMSTTNRARLDRGMLERIASQQRIVSEGYFATMGIAVRGPGFDGSERAETGKVAVIGTALAEQLWPGEEAVGRRFTTLVPPGPDDWYEVVGVAADVQNLRVRDAPEPQFYESRHQRRVNTMVLFTRTAMGASEFVDALRGIVAELDPEVPVFDVLPMRSAVAAALAGPRFNVTVFAAFAALALLLACGGLYGVVSFITARRRREIGIRIAVGASGAKVRRWVVRDSALPVGIGILAGLALAAAGARGLDRLLYGVRGFDLTTWLAAVVLLATTAAAACYLPARRAARVDPTVALRNE